MTYTCKTWERLEEGQDKSSNPLRTTHGYFMDCSVPEVGEGIRILCTPFVPGAGGRFIYTSNVKEITCLP